MCTYCQAGLAREGQEEEVRGPNLQSAFIGSLDILIALGHYNDSLRQFLRDLQTAETQVSPYSSVLSEAVGVPSKYQLFGLKSSNTAIFLGQSWLLTLSPYSVLHLVGFIFLPLLILQCSVHRRT